MSKKGFTLVEVLVSLTLVTVIAIFLFQIIYVLHDVYLEKTVKSELYIESSNLSNVINKSILNRSREGVTITSVTKNNDDSVTIKFSDRRTMRINIDRSSNTISYGDYSVSILPKANIGNIEVYYNYEMVELANNGVAYIRIPITSEEYNNDFSVRIFFRYNSTKTLITG